MKLFLCCFLHMYEMKLRLRFFRGFDTLVRRVLHSLTSLRLTSMYEVSSLVWSCMELISPPLTKAWFFTVIMKYLLRFVCDLFSVFSSPRRASPIPWLPSGWRRWIRLFPRTGSDCHIWWRCDQMPLCKCGRTGRRQKGQDHDSTEEKCLFSKGPRR